jgi:hypothetical protein
MMSKLTLADLHEHVMFLEKYDATRVAAVAEAIWVALDEEKDGPWRGTRRLADFPRAARARAVAGDEVLSQEDIIGMAAAAIYALDGTGSSRCLTTPGWPQSLLTTPNHPVTGTRG